MVLIAIGTAYGYSIGHLHLDFQIRPVHDLAKSSSLHLSKHFPDLGHEIRLGFVHVPRQKELARDKWGEIGVWHILGKWVQ